VKTETRRRAAAPPEIVTTIPGIALGELVEVVKGAGARVDYPGNPTGEPLPAVSTVAVDATDVGRAVALGFAEADPRRPILLGFVWHPDDGDADVALAAPAPAEQAVTVSADGERVVIEAEREITLRCGRASITLTRAGKILLRGAYLLSRSSGVNRIKGGSVQIN
jgi:hypothetical protein